MAQESSFSQIIIKKCKLCKKVKLIDQFYKNPNSKIDGHINQCKKCIGKIRKKYRQRPEIKRYYKNYNKEYHSKPEIKEKQKKKTREYVKNNRDKIKKNKDEYNQKPEVKNRKQERYSWPENRFKKIKKGAENRDIVFKISYTQYLSLIYIDGKISRPCHYCGGKTVNGLDRVDNDYKIGYVIENCVSCCEICNRMKLKLSKKEFINHIKKIVKNYNN